MQTSSWVRAAMVVDLPTPVSDDALASVIADALVSAVAKAIGDDAS